MNLRTLLVLVALPLAVVALAPSAAAGGCQGQETSTAYSYHCTGFYQGGCIGQYAHHQYYEPTCIGVCFDNVGVVTEGTRSAGAVGFVCLGDLA